MDVSHLVETEPGARYRIAAHKGSKHLTVGRRSVGDAFRTAQRLRELGWVVEVSRPGEVDLRAQVVRALVRP